MKTLHRLLMVGTVFSGVMSIQMAEASLPSGAPADNKATLGSVMLLAQAEPEKKQEPKKQEPKKQEPKKQEPKKQEPKKQEPKKQEPPKQGPAPPAAPAQKPATPPAAAPHPVPPPAAQPTRPPAPPAVQAPPRPPAPPAQTAPPRTAPPAPQQQPAPPATRPAAPPAAQPQPPGRPVTPPPATQAPARPPAAQTAPQVAPPAAPGQPPAVPGRPVAPPAAQGQPPAPAPVRPVTPPAAQPQPPADTGRPVAPPAATQTPARPPGPPAAQSAPQAAPPAAPTTAAPPAGVAPNTQQAPLQRSGVPAPTPQQAQPITPAAVGSGLVPQSAQGQPLRRMDQLRAERKQTTEGTRTIIREPDRTIIREGGQTVIRHSEVDRFRYGARDVQLERRGNDNVTVVIRPDGGRIVTVVDENGFLLRRSRIMPDGREIIIIDNRPRGAGFRPGSGFGGFFVDLAPPVIRIPRDRYIVEDERASPEILYETLIAEPTERIERAYSLDEILYTAPLRDRMPRIDLNTVTFDTGSWELSPSQIEKLAILAESLNRAIKRNPREVFLIEGHTDAVGSDEDNLSLSDRRAESVAIALTQQFNVPAENLTTQGYGKQYLKIQTQAPERANRRVTVRRITPLLTGQAQ